MELSLFKKIKHHCLAGDIGKVGRICGQLQEQSEQLIEICKMLNQISPTHKMKITTKELAIWFELNLGQLLSTIHCLAQNPRSKVAKDCTWAYIQGEYQSLASGSNWKVVYRDRVLHQAISFPIHSSSLSRLTLGKQITNTVWCSFYDDFCQLARQVAYLAHSQYDSNRYERVASLCHQVLLRRRLSEQTNVVGQQRCHEPPTSGSSEHQFCGSICDGGAQVGLIADVSLLANNREPPCQQYGGLGNQQQQQASSIEYQHQKVEDRMFVGDLRSHSHSHSHSQVQTRSLSQARSNNMDVMLDNALTTSRLLALSNRLVEEQQRHKDGTLGQFINHANSVQSLNMVDTFSDTTDSPRSLDHYYGFGSNYHSHNRPRVTAPRPSLGNKSSENYDLQASCLQSSPEIEYRRQQQIQQRQSFKNQINHYQQQLLPQDLSYEYDSQRENVAGEQGAYYNRQPADYRDQWIPVQDELAIQPPAAPARRDITTIEESPQIVERKLERKQRRQQHLQFADPSVDYRSRSKIRDIPEVMQAKQPVLKAPNSNIMPQILPVANDIPAKQASLDSNLEDQDQMIGKDTDQQLSATEPDKWSDSDADAIVRGAKEIAQMALSMYQFTKGEGELNTTQDLFTQAELFAEEANELYKEVRCFSYKVS